MLDAVSGLTSLIIESFNSFVTGIGTGVSTFFQSIFLTNTGTDASPVWELSTFASVSFVMLGVSLAIGLTTLVVHWVRGRHAN